MKPAANAALLLTALACAAALALSIYPGWLTGLAFVVALLAMIIVPPLALAGAVALALRLRKGKLLATDFPRAQAAVAATLLLFTYAALRLHLPMRLAFANARGDFETHLPNAPTSASQGVSLHQRLGLYDVDEYATDPRGGVYFRTHTGGDGLSPNRTSFGFAFHPNPQGSPFGAAQYARWPLGGGWYGFRASDDRY